jgi:hypothetical protein
LLFNAQLSHFLKRQKMGSVLKEWLFFRDSSENPACLQCSRTVGFSTAETAELNLLKYIYIYDVHHVVGFVLAAEQGHSAAFKPTKCTKNALDSAAATGALAPNIADLVVDNIVEGIATVFHFPHVAASCKHLPKSKQ